MSAPLVSRWTPIKRLILYPFPLIDLISVGVVESDSVRNIYCKRLLTGEWKTDGHVG